MLKRISSVVSALVLAAALPVAAQSVTLPPSGDNQKSSVTQHIGLVTVSVDYSSPDVHAPDGADRRGKIWGGLVPYGWHEDNFGACGKQCPWRGGANENTVFTTSHDIQIEGQPLPAGRYGLFFVPGESEWTVIFSKNSTSWGHYFYDAAEDALRVTVKPEKAAYREWLTYDFTDREGDKATLALAWEELAVPIRIAVPNAVELYAENLKRELRSSPGFTADAWQQAAQYLVQQKAHLDWAETWAQNAVSLPFIGKESFGTLKTLAEAQAANGKADAAKATMAKALAHPTATVTDYYQYARPMIREGKAAEAMALFQQAAKRWPGAWPTDVGIARAYSAMGDYKQALKHARAALAIAPDDVNKKNLERMIGLLEQGKDMNQ